MQEHDTALDRVCHALLDANLTLNKDKCEFHKSTLKFFGHIFSGAGMKPDPEKIAALNDTPRTRDAGDIRLFLGMASYCAYYIKDYATISYPLRKLTKQGHPFQWTTRCNQAFHEIKDAVKSANNFAYFNPRRKTEITVDASPVGRGAILAQYDRESDQRYIVAYASRSLTDTERAYSQPEKESLAVVWACEHFHTFIYGKHFTLITDHQALITIFGNPRAKMPPRIERRGIRLQEYTYTIIHKPGKAANPAGYMSRHPKAMSKSNPSLAEEYIHFVVAQAKPPAAPLEGILDATNEDATLQNVKHRIQTNRWRHLDEPGQSEQVDSQELSSFRHVKDELSNTSDGLILRTNGSSFRNSCAKESST